MKDLLLEDFQLIAESNIPFREFQNTTVLVTGATGLVGSLLVKALLFCSKFHGLDMRILALVRNLSKAERIFHPGDDALQYVAVDLEKDELHIGFKIDYVGKEP